MSISAERDWLQRFERDGLLRFYENCPPVSHTKTSFQNECEKRGLTVQEAINSLPIQTIMDYRMRFLNEHPVQLFALPPVRQIKLPALPPAKPPAFPGNVSLKTNTPPPENREQRAKRSAPELYVIRPVRQIKLPALPPAKLPAFPGNVSLKTNTPPPENREQSAKRSAPESALENLPPKKRQKFDLTDLAAAAEIVAPPAPAAAAPAVAPEPYKVPHGDLCFKFANSTETFYCESLRLAKHDPKWAWNLQAITQNIRNPGDPYVMRPTVSPKIMEIVLKYLYLDTLQYGPNDIEECFKAVHLFGIKALKNMFLTPLIAQYGNAPNNGFFKLVNLSTDEEALKPYFFKTKVLSFDELRGSDYFFDLNIVTFMKCLINNHKISQFQMFTLLMEWSKRNPNHDKPTFEAALKRLKYESMNYVEFAQVMQAKCLPAEFIQRITTFLSNGHLLQSFSVNSPIAWNSSGWMGIIAAQKVLPSAKTSKSFTVEWILSSAEFKKFLQKPNATLLSPQCFNIFSKRNSAGDLAKVAFEITLTSERQISIGVRPSGNPNDFRMKRTATSLYIDLKSVSPQEIDYEKITDQNKIQLIISLEEQ